MATRPLLAVAILSLFLCAAVVCSAYGQEERHAWSAPPLDRAVSVRDGRTGERLTFDAKTETFVANDSANRLIKREYRKPFEIPETV